MIKNKDSNGKNVHYDEKLRRFNKELRGNDHRHFLQYLEEFIRKHPPMRKTDGSYAYPDESEQYQINKMAKIKPAGFNELLASLNYGFPGFRHMPWADM